MAHGKRVFFNGIEIIDEPMEFIISIIRLRPTPKISYIVTPNTDHFSRLDKNYGSFLEAYRCADYRVCDSRIIKKLSRFEHRSIENVIPGSDLTAKILEEPWIKECELLLIGPSLEDSEIVKTKFSLHHMKTHTPPMGFIADTFEVMKCVDLINKTKPDIVFIAVGSPQQEILANRIKSELNELYNKNTIMLCVGASFDFLSGQAKRAPKFIQGMHLEWLHRAISNPRRLIPRYWSNFLWICSYILKKLLKVK